MWFPYSSFNLVISGILVFTVYFPISGQFDSHVKKLPVDGVLTYAFFFDTLWDLKFVRRKYTKLFSLVAEKMK